ncbi:MAG: glycosyltransferase family 39 protein [Candidatus Moranbacteria bacterium]|jgi:4-amino-4-deoxy-L-arabinose transferase-like glycosyltransferase|nr:glycosyltransferase family 39 protein [Candidatus Moranbacteria bacterium]
MKFTQFNKDFWKKPGFVLFLILFSFFLREVFLASVFPIFSGQDEARHYNSIQYLAEPKEKTWEITKNKDSRSKKDFSTYNFSEEIQNTGNTSGISNTRRTFDRMNFPAGSVGENENQITSKIWSQNNLNSPPDIVKGSFYHALNTPIEKLFGNKSILVRFYLIRIFSALLGTLFILISYFIFKNSGFSTKHSLIISTVISFQPKLSAYFTNINYDTLQILMFALFTLGGVLFLKKGLGWKNSILLVASLAIGVMNKGTALMMFPVLVGLTIFWFVQKYQSGEIKKKYIIPVVLLFLVAISALNWKFELRGFAPKTEHGTISEITASLSEYLSKSLPKIDSSAKNYWGNLDWNRNDYSEVFIRVIWLVELFSAIGVIWLLFSKKPLPFLPEKKYVWFFLGMIAALQFGIRFYDWKIFSILGTLDLGTPGRYFLPTITSHMALVFAGLGMILRKEKYLNFALLFWLLLMFAFSMYLTFDVIVPRFYL